MRRIPNNVDDARYDPWFRTVRIDVRGRDVQMSLGVVRS